MRDRSGSRHGLFAFVDRKEGIVKDDRFEMRISGEDRRRLRTLAERVNCSEANVMINLIRLADFPVRDERAQHDNTPLLPPTTARQVGARA